MKGKREYKTKFNVIVREQKTDTAIWKGFFCYDECINCCCKGYVGLIDYIEDIEEHLREKLNRSDFYVDVTSIVNLVSESKIEEEEKKSKDGQEEKR